MNATSPITVTKLDYERLRQMIDRSVTVGPRAITPTIALLSQSLMRAQIVDPADVPRQVATINSRVTYAIRGPDDQARIATVTLVPPADADLQLRRASVLAPTGSALLGLAEGESIDWPDEAGQTVRYTLLKVIYQPEAVGRFDL